MQRKEIEIRGLKYIVCDNGDIYGMKRGKLKQRESPDGYMQVTVGIGNQRTKISVHRLVALAFIPNPDNLPEVNHKDFNRKNNSVYNLEWCTHLYNIKYSYEHNLNCQLVARDGSKNGRSLLTEEQVLNIRTLYESGKYSISDLSRQNHCGWQTINHIVKHTTWTHI